jgi:hypothetical protein
MTPLLINNKPVVLNIGARIRLTEENLTEYDDHVDIDVDLSGVCDPYLAMELAGHGRPVIKEDKDGDV